MLANDPDLHNVNKFIITNLPAGLSADDKGKITGTPNVPAGNHAFNATARDEFYNQTIAPSSAETVRTFTLPVADESFAVNLTVDNNITSTIYVYPAGAVLPLYYGPVQFNAKASVTTPTSVTYSLSGNPAWLTINPNTGVIQGTPADNTNDIGDKNVTVKATTNNGCQVMVSKNFTIHVLANRWCGDGIVNGTEECEAGGAGTSATNQRSCASCRWSGGWCGDGAVNGGEQCDDGNSVNGDGCNSAATGCRYVCGDGHPDAVLGEQCDSSNLNGKTCVDYGWSGGTLSCNSLCQANTASCQYVYYEVPGAREYSNYFPASGFVSAYWNMTNYSCAYTTGWCILIQSPDQKSSTPNASSFITRTDYGSTFRAVWSWGNCAASSKGVCKGCDYVNDAWIFTYQKQYGVSATACIGNCVAKECGSNGCSGSCGTCAEGGTCVNSRCQYPPPPPPESGGGA